MKVDHVIKRTTILELSEEEAAWLHGNMQNPLHGEDPSSESDEDAGMRHRFFDATKPTHTYR